MKRKNTQKGFSLIELLVVSTVIIVITTIGLVSFTSAGKGARDGKRKADLEAVRQALVLYKADGNAYPTGAGTNGSYVTVSASLISAGYLSNPRPDDPKNTAPYQYSYYAPATGDSFCLCAYAEDDDIANQSATNCPLLGLSTPAYYCVQNP